MYYDEQTRSFNLASGLALGAMLGVGLTLMLAPRRPAMLPDARRLGRRARRRAEGATAALRTVLDRG